MLFHLIIDYLQQCDLSYLKHVLLEKRTACTLMRYVIIILLQVLTLIIVNCLHDNSTMENNILNWAIERNSCYLNIEKNGNFRSYSCNKDKKISL